MLDCEHVMFMSEGEVAIMRLKIIMLVLFDK